MNLLSASKLHSYLLPTEHLNPHLADSSDDVPLYKDQRIKRGKESYPPLSSLQYLILPDSLCLGFPLGFIS
jgi:hypothetical protein